MELHILPRKLSLSMPLSTLAALAVLGLAAVPAAQAQQSLYVANFGDSTISKFSSAGVGTQFNVSGDISGATLAINSAGDLFVANVSDNTIEEFNSAGVGTRFDVSGDVNGPASLAFGPSSPAAPVPEASTTVSLGLLLSLGLSGMMLAARRRKQAWEPHPAISRGPLLKQGEGMLCITAYTVPVCSNRNRVLG